MMKKILVLLLLIVSVESYPNQEIDSLKQTLSSLTDSNLVQQYLGIGERYYMYYNNADSIYAYGVKARDASLKCGHDKLLAKSISFIAIAFSKKWEFDSSFFHYETALKIAERAGDDFRIAGIYNNMGYNYDQTDESGKAIECYLKSLKYYEKMNQPGKVVMAYTNIASIFGQNDQFDESKEYLKKARFKLPQLSDPYALVTQYTSIAALYTEFGIEEPEYLDTAQLYIEKALSLSKENDFKGRVAESFNILSTIHYLRKEFKLCMMYSDSALLYADEANLETIIRIYIRYSDSYEGLKNMPSAFVYLDTALAMASEQQLDYYKMVIYERYYEYHRNLKDYKAAMHSLDSLRTVEDRLFDQEKNQAINDLDKKYQTEKKEREIQKLRYESELQGLKIERKNYLIGFLIVLALAIVSFVYAFFRQKSIRQERAIAEAKERLLRVQMNPHFFFNALMSIQTYFLKDKDGKKAVMYLSKFSKLMRSVLESSMDEWISLEEEIQTLTNYMEIQKVRFDNTFDFEINADQELIDRECRLPPMIAQPFIENAIEHGLANQSGGGKVNVGFSYKQDKIALVIEDNGIGVEQSKQKKNGEQRKSRAIQITRDRLFILNKNKFTDKDLIIEEIGNNGTVDGTRVSINLPLINDERGNY